jgi:hypothetical protein
VTTVLNRTDEDRLMAHVRRADAFTNAATVLVVRDQETFWAMDRRAFIAHATVSYGNGF